MNWKMDIQSAKEQLEQDIKLKEVELTKALESEKIPAVVKAFEDLEMLLGYRYFKGDEARSGVYDTFLENVKTANNVTLVDMDEDSGYTNRHRMIKILDGAERLGYMSLTKQRIEVAFNSTREKLHGLEKEIETYKAERESYKKKVKEAHVRLLMAEDEEEKNKHIQNVERYERFIALRNDNIKRAEEKIEKRKELFEQCDRQEQRIQEIADRHGFRVENK